MGRLDQVLGNLMANALRHTPPAGRSACKRRTDATDGVRITVRDTGEGIPAEDLPYIFDRFWRGDRARSHASGAGSGLGLAIARQLVQAHGGASASRASRARGRRSPSSCRQMDGPATSRQKWKRRAAREKSGSIRSIMLTARGSIKMSDTIDTVLNRRRKVSSFSSWLARFIMRVMGWQFVGEPPDIPKYVLIAAPHTSNWDFMVMLALDFAFKIRCVWMGKEGLFRGHLGPFYRRLGGIPIDRNSRSNVVEQAVRAFQHNERMVLAIPPEGTRRRTERWKTGFYYIALGANVPLVFGFIDFEHKAAGFGPTLMPSGDIEADVAIIRDFYKDIKGKFPENFGEVTVAAQKT